MAKLIDLSTNKVTYVVNEPLTGNAVASSAKLDMVANITDPTKIHTINKPKGPAWANELPEDISRPLPIDAPNDIHVKCLVFNRLDNGELAVINASLSNCVK